MTQPDYYQTLGVSRDASALEIRTAFRRLAKHHHPDLGDILPGRLQDLHTAYRCLSDRASRAEHDRMLATMNRQHFLRQLRLIGRLRRHDRRRASLRWSRRWCMAIIMTMLLVAWFMAA